MNTVVYKLSATKIMINKFQNECSTNEFLLRCEIVFAGNH